MPLAVDTSGRIYDDFSSLLFLHAHCEAAALANELQLLEESGQFRFLRAACLANLKGSVEILIDLYTARFVFSAFYTTTAFHSF